MIEKLNELVALAEKADAVANLMGGVNPHTILAIAEAFRDLENRASNLNDGWLNAIAERDEARAKLAELEQQEPVAYWHRSGQVVTREESHNDKIFAICCKVERPLFTRPATVADLAALVPPMKDDSIPGKNDSYIDMCDGWNACRAAMLRKIEEAK